MSNPLLDRAATAIAEGRTDPRFTALEPIEKQLLAALERQAPELDQALVGAAWLILAEGLGQVVASQQGHVDPSLLVNLGQLAGQRLYSGTDRLMEVSCPLTYSSGAPCKFSAKVGADGLVDAMMATHYATYHPGESWPPVVDELDVLSARDAEDHPHDPSR
jgi:hypothetical protein